MVMGGAVIQILVSLTLVALIAEPAAADPSAPPTPGPETVMEAWTEDRTRGLEAVQDEATAVAVMRRDDDTTETVATVMLPTAVSGLAVASGGGAGVAVAPGGDDGIAWIRLSDGTVAATFQSAPEMTCRRCVALAADGSRAVVVGAADRRQAVTVLGGGPPPFIVDEVALTAMPDAVEISADQRFAVVHTADGSTTVLRLADGGVVGSYRD